MVQWILVMSMVFSEVLSLGSSLRCKSVRVDGPCVLVLVVGLIVWL